MSLISPLSINQPADLIGVDPHSRKNPVDEWLHQSAFLLDSMSDAVFSTDLDFVIKSWNKGAEEIYGLTADQVVGRGADEVLCHEFLAEDRGTVWDKLRSTGKWKGEVKLTTDSGKRLFLEINSSSIMDQSGSTIGYVSICRDITEMHGVKEALLSERQRFSDLIQNVPGVVYQWEENFDGTYGFTYISPKLEEYFGTTPEEVFANGSLIHPEDRQRFRDSIEEANRTENPWNFEGRLLYPDGSIKWWRGSSILSMKTEKGRIYNGIIFDITGQKDMERMLMEEEAQKKSDLIKAIMEAQEKERREISSELHDNVNQILTTCKLLLEIARNNPSDPQFIDGCYNNIQMVIQEIRNISHSLTPHTLKDLGLVPAIRDLVERINQSGKLAIRLFADPDIRENSLSPDIMLALFRIIQEKISNVLKHARASELRIGISLRDNTVKLHLSDNGQGFDEKAVKKGLGLNNIHHRVEYYKGTLQIVTAPGRGCELTIELPCGL
ncbi:MAG: PAS domain S-box protein [Bacteroidota bacterium]|nr:PAS domain S-box protein [Bacteroidota bacterium]